MTAREEREQEARERAEDRGILVRRARKGKGLSVAALARLAGLTTTTIKNIEAGAHTLREFTAQQLAPHLGLKVSDLWTGPPAQLALARQVRAQLELAPASAEALRQRLGVDAVELSYALKLLEYDAALESTPAAGVAIKPGQQRVYRLKAGLVALVACLWTSAAYAGPDGGLEAATLSASAADAQAVIGVVSVVVLLVGILVAFGRR